MLPFNRIRFAVTTAAGCAKGNTLDEAKLLYKKWFGKLPAKHVGWMIGEDCLWTGSGGWQWNFDEPIAILNAHNLSAMHPPEEQESIFCVDD